MKHVEGENEWKNVKKVWETLEDYEPYPVDTDTYNTQRLYSSSFAFNRSILQIWHMYCIDIIPFPFQYNFLVCLEA